jgi:hypothetical protein
MVGMSRKRGNERNVQADIRRALCGRAKIWRVNVGQAWTGAEIQRCGRTMTITDPRPFDSGLSSGFPDLFGWQKVRIQPEDVGRDVAVFVAIEVKRDDGRGRVSAEQQQFLAALKRDGGKAGVAESVNDALAILFSTPDGERAREDLAQG